MCSSTTGVGECVLVVLSECSHRAGVRQVIDCCRGYTCSNTDIEDVYVTALQGRVCLP